MDRIQQHKYDITIRLYFLFAARITYFSQADDIFEIAREQNISVKKFLKVETK